MIERIGHYQPKGKYIWEVVEMTVKELCDKARMTGDQKLTVVDHSTWNRLFAPKGMQLDAPAEEVERVLNLTVECFEFGDHDLLIWAK